MKRLLKLMKKNWIRVWLVAVLVIGSAFAAYAAYTEVSAVKRVVSTTASPGQPFSSNCMTKEISSHRLESGALQVTVCNYDQDFPGEYSTSEIKYILEAELRIKMNNGYKTFSEVRNLVSSDLYNRYVSKAANYWIYKSEDDQSGVIQNAGSGKRMFTEDNSFKVLYGTDGDESTYEALKARKSSTDVYTVRLDPADAENEDALFFVFVKAIPKGGALYDLSARLYTNKSNEDKADWDGSILESISDTVDYDFYNYIITGSGIGSVDILWNKSKLEINKFFLQENSLSPETILASDATYGSTYGDGNWKKVTIPVNSTVKSRYELQLYKVVKGELIADPRSYIVCVFNKS